MLLRNWWLGRGDAFQGCWVRCDLSMHGICGLITRARAAAARVLRPRCATATHGLQHPRGWQMPAGDLFPWNMSLPHANRELEAVRIARGGVLWARGPQ
jgi:hypothetical protein